MDMKLEQLRSLETVVRLGTFTRAAEELFLAQPSLSRQIAALEKDLGAVLLHRDRGGARPTAAGAAVLPIARRMLADAETAHRELDELAGLRRGRVRLGAPPSLCVSLVADVLAVFAESHPGIDLLITEAGSHDLVRALEQGELDLALLVTHDAEVRSESIALEPLLREELVVVSSASRTRGQVPAELTLAQLADLRQVVFHRGYDLRIATDAAFASAGLRPQVAVEGAEMDAVLRFVERGIGVAVVPAMVAVDRPELHSSRLVRPGLERTVNLAERPRTAPSTAAGALRQLVFETVETLTFPGVLGLRGDQRR